MAIASTTVRRAHRIVETDELQYVYHYTGFDTFEKIFPNHRPSPTATAPSTPYQRPRLLLSPTELLNDPNEGSYFFATLHKQATELRNLGNDLIDHRRITRSGDGLKATDPLVFVASLCMEDDNLNLWRFYGGAKGVSFGVHRSQFDLSTDEGIADDYAGADKLYRVKYGDIEVNRALSHLKPALGNLASLYHLPGAVPFRQFIVTAMSALLGGVAYLFKTESYEAEKECRLLRILSIADTRGGTDWEAIGGIVRIKSNVEFIHDGVPPPIVTLGPQFDINNPERGQTRAIDRIRGVIDDRAPTVKLSGMKYRAPDSPPHMARLFVEGEA